MGNLEGRDGDGNESFSIRSWKGQERWLNGQEHERKSATGGGEELESISKKRQGRCLEINGVNLAVTHYIGDMELEEATNCDQTGTPVA